jgi:hypothetical protein
VGVIFHFLNKDLKVRNLLAGIRQIKEAKTEENIAETVIPIIKEIVSGTRLGFFIKNNVSENSTVIRAILICHECQAHMPNSGGAAHHRGADGATVVGQCSCTSLITRAFLYLWLRGPEISFCYIIDHYKTSLYYKALHCTIFRPRTQGSVIIGSSHYY